VYIIVNRASHLAIIYTVSQSTDFLRLLLIYQLKIISTFAQQSLNPQLTATMSLGSFQFPESYCRAPLGFNDTEREVCMILTNMRNGSMAQMRDPLLILADGKPNSLQWFG
jgi:hypothetical protein